MRRPGAMIPILLLSSALPVIAQGVGVAVEVGGSADYDACATQARISIPDHPAQASVTVHEAPGVGHVIIDHLVGGDLVHLCDRSGEWRGIVYGDEDCGVMSPIPDRRPYAGPCKSGWVTSYYLEDVAG